MSDITVKKRRLLHKTSYKATERHRVPARTTVRSSHGSMRQVVLEWLAPAWISDYRIVRRSWTMLGAFAFVVQLGHCSAGPGQTCAPTTCFICSLACNSGKYYEIWILNWQFGLFLRVLQPKILLIENCPGNCDPKHNS